MKFIATHPMYLNAEDEQYDKYKKQLDEDGFSDSELWNLDVTIAEFILPRLKRFRDYTQGWPCQRFDTFEDWQAAIDKMIESFEFVIEDDCLGDGSEQYQEGMDLFCSNFRGLWD